MRRFLLALAAVLALSMGPWTSPCAQGIHWLSDYGVGLEKAAVERKPIMIDFYTSWCYYCKVLDARTYTNPEVIRLSNEFASLKINAEKERRLARSYRIAAYPIIVFLSRHGTEIKRLYGYQPPATLANELRRILNDSSRLDNLAEGYRKKPSDVEAAYLYADELMAKERYDDAQAILRKILKSRNASRIPDATLDLAVCSFKNGDYKEATAELDRFLNRFEGNRRINEAELFYGLSLLGLNQKEKGIERLTKLSAQASGTWLAQEALRQVSLAQRETG